MKRCNIECGFIYEFNDLFRPSKREQIRRQLQVSRAYTVRDVCLMSEKDFRKFDFATDYIFKKIKERMRKSGLRFGMTEQELDDYMDAEYLEEHGEELAQEASSNGEQIKPVWDDEYGTVDFRSALLNEAEDKATDTCEEEQAPADEATEENTEKLPDENPTSEKEETAEAVESQELEDTDEMKMFRRILHEHRVQVTLRESYLHQPWWMKLFCSSNKRYESAILETMSLCCGTSSLAQLTERMDKDVQAKVNKQLSKKKDN